MSGRVDVVSLESTRTMLSQLLQKPIQVGNQIIKCLPLTSAEISYFARLCGDNNPLHHDEDYARKTRFGEIIACGAHTTSLLIGMTGTYFSQDRMMVGLEYHYRLLTAVKAGNISVMWEIIDVQQTKGRSGLVVSIEGAVKQERQIAVAANGKVLIAHKL